MAERNTTPESEDSDTSTNIDDLFARARAGDQSAWEALYHECLPKVRRAVRQRLNIPLRRYVDSTDIINEVFGDLAAKASRFEFESIHSVRKFLCEAAYQRIIDEHRRRSTKKRNRNRECSMFGDPARSDVWAISSGEPTASQVAVANEADQRLNDAPMSAQERSIIDLRRQNFDNKAISVALGVTVRHVQRSLEKLRTTFWN